jgi:hypothetical protein
MAVATVLMAVGAACGDRAPTPGAATRGAPAPTRGASAGWTVTVYYTAVEKYHSGKPAWVTGCPRIDCQHGNADLGTYPEDFVTAVKDEGTGITAAGRYLNWSFDTGYWLDDAARDTAGRPLRPFESAAADAAVLAAGTRFTIADCGRADDGSAVPAQVCGKLRDARWVISDEFTPGLGGERHIDVYIGEETGPGFTDGPWYTTLERATLHID